MLNFSKKHAFKLMRNKGKCKLQLSPSSSEGNSPSSSNLSSLTMNNICYKANSAFLSTSPFSLSPTAGFVCLLGFLVGLLVWFLVGFFFGGGGAVQTTDGVLYYFIDVSRISISTQNHPFLQTGKINIKLSPFGTTIL